MPAKMMKLMPFPRPRSLISSPSHISRIVPAVNESSRLKVWKLKNEAAGRTPAFWSRTVKPYPCAKAIGTVSSRVYWLSRFRPYSPSRASSPRLGITPCMSCMMMLALIYGFTPMPTMDAVASPPPENRSSRPSSWFELNRLASWVWLTFGTGTLVRTRKMSRIPRVKRILRRISGARRAVTTESIT